MAYDPKTTEKLRGNFQLLSSLIRYAKYPELKVSLGEIEKTIAHRIPETLQHHAPADFHVLYGDFKAEYERFKDFILYDKLIGKNTVALGGGFSSGKSSFLNALLGQNVLPSDIDPSTSVPTYIVNGASALVQGFNVFNAIIDIEPRALKKIAHGFGHLETEDQDGQSAKLTDQVTLGHILKKLFISTPSQTYRNIAFLDTPGYSKPDDKNYSANTDEQIAHDQLNSSDFILWFIQADAGTITEEDIGFIRTLRADIPKLFILNKADKKTDKDVADIIAKIKQVLTLKSIRYIDVLAFSSSKSAESEYDIVRIREQLDRWDEQVYKANFARNFKTIFMRCKQYYEDEMEQESRRLSWLNKALLVTEEAGDILNPLIGEIKKNIAAHRHIYEQLKQLQVAFFTEIKIIGDNVGIEMPEPSEIDLIRDNAADPLQLLKDYRQSKGSKPNKEYLRMLRETMTDLKPVLSKKPGGSHYTNELVEVIRANCRIDRKQIRINDAVRMSKEYKELFDAIRPTNGK